MTYKLTVRHGPHVEREQLDDLDAALAGLERHASAVRADGPLPTAKMLREFEPSERVAARLEISAGGAFRRTSAGVDVMGDGAVVAFSGGVRRRRLEPLEGETPLDAVRRELAG